MLERQLSTHFLPPHKNVNDWRLAWEGPLNLMFADFDVRADGGACVTDSGWWTDNRFPLVRGICWYA